MVLRRSCLQKVTLASVIFALACGNDQRLPTAPTVVMHPPLVCPTDVLAVSQDGLAVAVHFDVPTVDRVTAVCSPPPGSLFEVGMHEVTCARSDNPAARCSFLVSVTLPGGPEIVGPTSFTVVEGETAVGTLMATDADTPAADLVWSPAGGADSGHFTLDESGALRFAVPKDYEAPDDAGGDGTYELTVQVSDGTDAATAAIRVALANRNEAPTANAGADQSGVQEGATVTLRGGGGGPRRGRHASVRVDADRRRHGHAVDAGSRDDNVRGPDRAHRERGADVHPAGDRRGRPLGRGHGGGHRRPRRWANWPGDRRSDVVHGG